MGDRWLSVDEVAIYLGIKHNTVYKWIVRKNMPSHKVGRLWKFWKGEIDERVRSAGTAEKDDKTVKLSSFNRDSSFRDV